MERTFEKAAVLGATGPTGIHLVPRLREQGLAVRVVSRSAQRLEQSFGALGVERHAADLVDAAGTRRAVDGCDLAFNCVGLPAEAMERHAVVAHNVVAAAAAAGARCVHVSSCWAYLPVVETPVNERHPRTGGGPWVRHRRAAENVHLEAGAAVVHLPDFYGPHVHVSTLQQALAEAAQGKAMSWIGAADTPREYVFVPDAMATVSRLATHEAAYGEHWIVPGSGPLTGRQAARIAGRVLGRDVKLRAAGLTLLRLVGLFNKALRDFLQIAPEYVKPVTYDAGKLEGLLGAQPRTSYDDGIRKTLEWLTER